MGYAPTKFIWFNSEFVPWREATVHVLAHGLQYGSCVFEGVRAYETPSGAAVFRNHDHARRLLHSAKMLGMELPVGLAEIESACRDVVSRNGLRSAYIRPCAYRREGTLGLTPIAANESPVDVAVVAIEWGKYLGEAAMNNGIDVCVTSWRRPPSASLPMTAKAGGYYLNAQLIGEEAKRHGYDEGIALDTHGNLAEGSSENLFVVRRGVLCTTPVSSSILDGITRDTVLTLARELGIDVREQAMPRDVLYTSDEIFLTGTAAEVTPVRSVDRRPVGDGLPGPITKTLQHAFFGLFNGQTPDRWGWLDLVVPVENVPSHTASTGRVTPVVATQP